MKLNLMEDGSPTVKIKCQLELRMVYRYEKIILKTNK